jgi:hypothetical protein
VLSGGHRIGYTEVSHSWTFTRASAGRGQRGAISLVSPPNCFAGGGRSCLTKTELAELVYRTTARLHPRWVGGRDGYRFSVIHDGKLLVDRSRDPGKLTILDGKTGRPRTIIDIEKAAKLTVKEGSNEPRFQLHA